MNTDEHRAYLRARWHRLYKPPALPDQRCVVCQEWFTPKRRFQCTCTRRCYKTAYDRGWVGGANPMIPALTQG